LSPWFRPPVSFSSPPLVPLVRTRIWLSVYSNTWLLPPCSWLSPCRYRCPLQRLLGLSSCEHQQKLWSGKRDTVLRVSADFTATSFLLSAYMEWDTAILSSFMSMKFCRSVKYPVFLIMLVENALHSFITRKKLNFVQHLILWSDLKHEIHKNTTITESSEQYILLVLSVKITLIE
jgi:hypothetical protein